MLPATADLAADGSSRTRTRVHVVVRPDGVALLRFSWVILFAQPKLHFIIRPLEIFESSDNTKINKS